jgi:hypothetical protein
LQRRHEGRYAVPMRFISCLTAVLAVSAPALGAPSIAVPPQLRQSAMLCLGEALRLCPDALAAKDHGVSCILGKRRLLSAPCRNVYDQGVRLLKGGDIHIQLRPPKTP